MVTSRNKRHDPETKLCGKLITVTNCQRHLDVILAANMKWDKHIDAVLSRARRLLGVLRLSSSASVNFYKAHLRPLLEYADIVLSNLPQQQIDQLECFQLCIARIILRLPLYSHTSHSYLLTTLNLPTLSSCRDLNLTILAFKLKQKSAPDHLLSVSFGA